MVALFLGGWAYLLYRELQLDPTKERTFKAFPPLAQWEPRLFQYPHDTDSEEDELATPAGSGTTQASGAATTTATRKVGEATLAAAAADDPDDIGKNKGSTKTTAKAAAKATAKTTAKATAKATAKTTAKAKTTKTKAKVAPGTPRKIKTSKDTTGKAVADGSDCCYHCDTGGAKCSCTGCYRAWYCGRGCQKADWRRHKPACRAAARAEARRAAWRVAATAARRAGENSGGDETCVICIGPVVSPVELPCGHAYCEACLAELRAKEVAQACPLCRADLPPGVDGLWDLAYRAYKRIFGMVDRGEVSWASLAAADQEEMDEAVIMLIGELLWVDAPEHHAHH